jgi:hypothetical protein
MTHISSSWLSNSAQATSRRIHWLAAGIGLLASAACAAVLFSQPFGTRLQVAMDGAGHGSSFGKSIGASRGAQDNRPGAIQILAGIGGETFASGAGYAGLQDMHSDQRAPNVAPVLWDELSEASCLTVTAKTGQTFSFRILGVSPASPAHEGAQAPKIELAIAGCANNGESVVKAVIEQDTPPVARDLAPERSL